MNLKIDRQTLLGPLQQVTSVIERRHTMAILSNVRLRLQDGLLTLCGTDLEVEVHTGIPVQSEHNFETCITARKFLDIVRSMPEDVTIELHLEDGRIRLQAGRGKYVLSTLYADTFPTIEISDDVVQGKLPVSVLAGLLEKTSFAMAAQDGRYYLNGLFLELADGVVRTVATDGHRLAIAEAAVTLDLAPRSVIIPRKAVMELNRLLATEADEVSVSFGDNFVQFVLEGTTFISKIIEGTFPDYTRVLPSQDCHVLTSDRVGLRTALNRTAILANEKHRGIRLTLCRDSIHLSAHNPDQDVAEEDFDVDYQGPEYTIGFNVSYLLDVLGAIEEESVEIRIVDENSSVLISGVGNESSRYVVMPMRL